MKRVAFSRTLKASVPPASFYNSQSVVVHDGLRLREQVKAYFEVYGHVCVYNNHTYVPGYILQFIHVILIFHRAPFLLLRKVRNRVAAFCKIYSQILVEIDKNEVTG